MSEREEILIPDWCNSEDAIAYEYGYEAAKESSRKELEAEKEALEKKLEQARALICWMRGASIANVRDGTAGGALADCADFIQRSASDFGAEELTELLASARAEGFEEGKQAGRDELQQELSEQEPVAYYDRASAGHQFHSREYEVAYGNGFAAPLIPRPAPPTKKG